MTQPVTIYRTRNPLEAQMLRGALEAAGIDCHVVGEHQAGHSGVFDIELVVRLDDESAARELLAELHGR
jgi:hypothetical protein